MKRYPYSNSNTQHTVDETRRELSEGVKSNESSRLQGQGSKDKAEEVEVL
jgi:hypothetical protein